MKVIAALILSSSIQSQMAGAATLCTLPSLTDRPSSVSGCMCVDGMKILRAEVDPRGGRPLKIEAATLDGSSAWKTEIPFGVMAARNEDPVKLAHDLLTDDQLQLCCAYTQAGPTCVDISLTINTK